MDPLANPYGPGAGTPPPELTGRDSILDEVKLSLARIRRGMPHKSTILVGLRGVGKTVLLTRIEELARDMGYHAALIENTEEKHLPELLIPYLRRILFELDRLGAVSRAVKRGFRVLISFAGAIKVKLPGDVELGLDIDSEQGTADSGDLEADLADLFVALGEAARDRKTAVAIIIDELQYLKTNEFGALIMAIHRVNQRKLPIVLVGAGLPQIIGLAGKSKSYAERLFDFQNVGALNASDAERALVEPARRENVVFEPSAIADLLGVTKGYPYFLQEWGYQAWNLARDARITSVDVERATFAAIARLDAGFFKMRFDRSTPMEKRYLRAMAELGPGPHRSGDIALVYGVDVMSAGPIRGRLIAKGMIYSPAHGDNAFTVPLFDEYLKRTMPDVTSG